MNEELQEAIRAYTASKVVYEALEFFRFRHGNQMSDDLAAAAWDVLKASEAALLKEIGG